MVLCGQRFPGNPQACLPLTSCAEDHHLACFDDNFYPNQTSQELKGQAIQLSSGEMAKKQGGGLQNKGISLSVKSTYKTTQTEEMPNMLIQFMGWNVFKILEEITQC